jgi:hypothetical protein
MFEVNEVCLIVNNGDVTVVRITSILNNLVSFVGVGFLRGTQPISNFRKLPSLKEIESLLSAI